MNSPDLFR